MLKVYATAQVETAAPLSPMVNKAMLNLQTVKKILDRYAVPAGFKVKSVFQHELDIFQQKFGNGMEQYLGGFTVTFAQLQLEVKIVVSSAETVRVIHRNSYLAPAKYKSQMALRKTIEVLQDTFGRLCYVTNFDEDF
jgi:hypothetical protein